MMCWTGTRAGQSDSAWYSNVKWYEFQLLACDSTCTVTVMWTSARIHKTCAGVSC